MNTRSLAIVDDLRDFLIPSGADKDQRYRLGMFADWLQDTGRHWAEPDLAAYRDRLLDGTLGTEYAPATVAGHLATIRARFADIRLDNGTRDRLYQVAGQRYDRPADCKAFVDEVLVRLANAADARRSRVRVPVKQDEADGDHLRLTRDQADALLAAPGVVPLDRLRDTAILAVLLCTGIREAELAHLEVDDLRLRLGGELALAVRAGKGCKQRLIPYGAQEWVLAIVDKWLERAGIEDGPVFRGFYRGGALRPGGLSVRAIEDVVSAYPIVVDGALRHVRPHDLRRTYARRCYEEGMEPIAIQQNLGHTSLQTTLGYIGILDVDRRNTPAICSFDLRVLDRI